MIALHKVASGLGAPATKPMGKFPIHSAGQVATLAGQVENTRCSGVPRAGREHP